MFGGCLFEGIQQYVENEYQGHRRVQSEICCIDHHIHPAWYNEIMVDYLDRGEIQQEAEERVIQREAKHPVPGGGHGVGIA